MGRGNGIKGKERRTKKGESWKGRTRKGNMGNSKGKRKRVKGGNKGRERGK